MTIKERLKAWWEYFIDVYSAYGNKKEVPDPFIDELKSKGFEYEEDKDSKCAATMTSFASSGAINKCKTCGKSCEST